MTLTTRPSLHHPTHAQAVGLPPSARDPALPPPAAAASPFHQQYTHLHSPLPAAQRGRQPQHNTPELGPCPAQEVYPEQEQEVEQPHPPAPKQQPPQPGCNAPIAQLAASLATAATPAALAADPWAHMPAWWRHGGGGGGGGASSGGGSGPPVCGGGGPDGEAARALAAMAFSPDVPLLDWGRDIGALGACLGR